MSLCASQSAMKIDEIARFFDNVDNLITFFRSRPKRTTHLGHNMPRPGDMCWLSHDTAISAIYPYYEDFGTALYHMPHPGG